MPISSKSPVLGPEEGFKEVVAEIKLGFEEFEEVLTFIRARVEIENEYLLKLDKLQNNIPKEPCDFEPLWSQLKKSALVTMLQHKKFSAAVEKCILEPMNKELEFQKEKVKLFADDIYESFDDFNEKKNRLLSLQGNMGSALKADFDKDYREQLGSLERRRRVQVRLLKAAFARFIELENARLTTVKKGVGAHLQLELRQSNEILSALSHCLAPIKAFDESIMMAVYEKEWKSMMTLPPPVVYKDPQNGPLPDLTFGLNLVDHLCIHEAAIPPILAKAIREITFRGMTTPGLYLTPLAQESTFQALCVAYERHAKSFQWESISLETIVMLVKKYLLDLPEPLFPLITHESLKRVAEWSQEDIRLGLITQVIKDLPLEHLNTLNFILDHLAEIVEKNQLNGTTIQDLAAEFGKYLIRPQAEPSSGATSSSKIPCAPLQSFDVTIISDLLRNYTIMLGRLPKVKN